MKLISNIKKVIPLQVKFFLRQAVNIFIPGESIIKSKEKWNNLASKNARYFVLTDFGENITEEEFKKAGQEDFHKFIDKDLVIKERLINLNEKTVLEIGCGIGRITEFLSSNFKKVFAVDISEEMVKTGRERLKSLNNIEFISTNGMGFPSIPNSSVDLVFSYIVFQHMSNKKVVIENLKEIKRVLTPTGIAKIQLRGLPTSKFNWFYGPSFNESDIKISCGLYNDH